MRLTWDDIDAIAKTAEQRAAVARAKAGEPTHDYSRADRDVKPQKATAKKKRPRGRHRKGQMTKLEKRYAAWLDALKASGHVLAWVFEPFALQLAHRTTYTPDFLVFRPMKIVDAFAHAGGVEIDVAFVEVKPRRRDTGRPLWIEDARVKWKVAASMHARVGRFTAACPDDEGLWEHEEAPRA